MLERKAKPASIPAVTPDEVKNLPSCTQRARFCHWTPGSREKVNVNNSDNDGDPTARTLWRNFIIKALVCCCLATIELASGSEKHGSRADGKDIGRTVDQLTDLLEQNGIPNQRHHAESSGDKEGIELLLFLESFGQGKVGQNANAVFDGGFQAMRSAQIVDVDQLNSVVVTAGDNSAQRTKEI